VAADGLNTQQGTGSQVYVEITQPGQQTRYLTVASGILPGTSYRLAVAALPGKPDVWHVLVDGKAVTGAIYLPGSSAFRPMAMSESWNGGEPVCNGFAYSFNGLRIAEGGGWKPLSDTSALTDPGYKIINQTNDSFTALSV
jgi:hypothetical protein